MDYQLNKSIRFARIAVYTDDDCVKLRLDSIELKSLRPCRTLIIFWSSAKIISTIRRLKDARPVDKVLPDPAKTMTRVGNH